MEKILRIARYFLIQPIVLFSPVSLSAQSDLREFKFENIWSTYWFGSLVIILVAALAFYLYKRRMRADENQKLSFKEKYAESGHDLQEAKDQLAKQHEEIVVQKQELRLRERDQQELLWFNQGISTFSEIINKNKDDLTKLCQIVISRLIEYVDAQQGGIFLLNDENESDPFLELVASYAYAEEKINRRFMPGEGYIGTCFAEKQFLEIDNLTENYASLHSGLGRQVLKHLLLAPLKAGDNCIGVIELCSFRKIKGYRVSFVEKMIETLASTINTEHANKKMKIIIEDSKRRAKDLQEREDLLRMQLEENLAKQEESARREKEVTQAMEEAVKQVDTQKKEIEELQTALKALKKQLDLQKGKR